MSEFVKAYVDYVTAAVVLVVKFLELIAEALEDV